MLAAAQESNRNSAAAPRTAAEPAATSVGAAGLRTQQSAIDAGIRTATLTRANLAQHCQPCTAAAMNRTTLPALLPCPAPSQCGKRSRGFGGGEYHCTDESVVASSLGTLSDTGPVRQLTIMADHRWVGVEYFGSQVVKSGHAFG